MTLTNDEVYALTAYILNINEIEIDGKLIEEEFVLSRENFTKIHLPNEDGFEPKIRGKKGQENARAYYNDPKNFGGQKTRCMKNCFDGEAVIQRIGHPIDTYLPPMSTEKKLPEVEEETGVDPKVKKAYDASCAMCHATDSMGAPMTGDKKAWTATLKKGLDKVYHNAINGVNGMPPKGGNMSLSDDEVKAIVDLMIK
jgi:cytochrome c